MMETLAMRSGTPAAVEPPAPPPPPPQDIRPRFDPNDPSYDPEAGVREVFQRNFGGLANDLASRANEAVYMNYRSQFPDFGDFEKDIRGALSAGRTTGTPEQIQSLYYAFKGQKQTRQELAARNAASTQPPSPPRPEVPEPEALSEQEQKIARTLYRGHANPEAEYRKDLEALAKGPVVMKVKLSGGKTA